MSAPLKRGWLRRAGKFKVEHLPLPGPDEPVTLDRPAAGIMHTTEGSFESAVAVFRQHYAPTFLVGRDRKRKVRIVQMRPLGLMAAAVKNAPGGVETNRWARVQIEVVGNSQHTRWLPDLGVSTALAVLMRELQTAAGIPLRRRVQAQWGTFAGWYGHIDIPENDHWDPGELDYATLFRLAAARDPKPKLKRRPKLRKAKVAPAAAGGGCPRAE